MALFTNRGRWGSVIANVCIEVELTEPGQRRPMSVLDL